MSRTALITGIGGQDGYYLSKFLQSKAYVVHGIELPGKPVDPGLAARLHYVDVSQGSNLGALLDEVRPDEVYNLAGRSRVSDSFNDPIGFAEVNALGTVRLLEAIRGHRKKGGGDIKFYQASSSEMFGTTSHACQAEDTPFHPRSPYACAKVYAHLQTVNFREAFGQFACSGILFNHESPRRPEHFVTRKIARAAARIRRGESARLALGNIDVRRDWGFAGDYVEAMWLMLQQPEPGDYVVATGEAHSVREFCAEIFSHLGLDWTKHVDIDPALFRPAEIENVCGDASKAQRVLGWRPRVGFRELAHMMADSDLKLATESAR